MTKTLREEILSKTLRGNKIKTPEDVVDEILSKVGKRIDKVEQDYKNELNDWGKKQPITEMWPKQMETLERVRKEFGIKKK